MTRREFITMLGGVAGAPFLHLPHGLSLAGRSTCSSDLRSAGIVPIGTMLERRSEILSNDQWRTP
jgi:hypothetical protein